MPPTSAAFFGRRAQLIEGLGGEKARWLESADRLGVKYINLTGDVLVSAGVMAYLGPFTATFRSKQLSDWVALCKEKGISCSASPTLSGETPLVFVLWDRYFRRDLRNRHLQTGNVFLVFARCEG